MKKVICLCGASGTGKSTILNYVKTKYRHQVDVVEVSARPYLPKNTDYVNSLDGQSQVLITQNRFVDIVSGFTKKWQTLYSRSPLDSLAYEAVLGKAPFLLPLLQRQVMETKDKIQYIYIPVEFEMKDSDDIIRGTNTDVQSQTDAVIFEALDKFNIDYIDLSGNIKERMEKIDELFRAS